jgi:hypothetical protein
MKYLKSALCLALLAGLTSCTTPSATNSSSTVSVPAGQPLVVTHSIGQDVLTIRSEPKFAGAISSLVFRGQQYVNSDDHGRLMQGAIAYNDRFECLNPTQAGGSRDRRNLGKRSTSQRLQASPDGTSGFSVTTRMAYWFRPGMTCEVPGEGRQPVENRTRMSPDLYAQTHRFNYRGYADVVGLDVTYTIAQTYRSAVVEALTIYTPLAFDTFHSLDLASGELKEEPTTSPEETPTPIILSTKDGKSAIAFVSEQKGASYARFRFSDTNKISLVYRERNGISGVNRYKAAWVIGTRDEVVARVRELVTRAPQ